MPYYLAWAVSWFAAFWQFISFGTATGLVWLFYAHLPLFWSCALGATSGVLYWFLLSTALDRLQQYTDVEFEAEEDWLNK